MKRHALMVLSSIVLALVCVSVSVADVPSLINYQGFLRDAAGEIVPEGNYSVTFRIWDSETSGTALWQEGRLIAVQDGLFTVLLGSVVPIPDTLFSNPDRWIGLQIGLDAEMIPRQRLVAVPFAWQSLKSDWSDSANIALTVDTSGYSAYADLLSEGRIGPGPDQVAAGDHSHVIGIMSSIVDTNTAQVSVPGSQTVIKSIPIPASWDQSFIRVHALTAYLGNCEPTWYVRINGAHIYTYGDQGAFSVVMLKDQLPQLTTPYTLTLVADCGQSSTVGIVRCVVIEFSTQ